MKSLLIIFITFFALTANAQTADATTTTTTTTEVATVDVMISLPMMGNITIENCDKNMEEDLKPITFMKVVNKSDTKYIFVEEAQNAIATSFKKIENVLLP